MKLQLFDNTKIEIRFNFLFMLNKNQIIWKIMLYKIIIFYRISITPHNIDFIIKNMESDWENILII